MSYSRIPKLKPSGLHEGDKVVMHTCSEASLDKYKGKVFTCTSEPWDLCGSEVIMIDGVSGGFATEFLKTVDPESLCISCGEKQAIIAGNYCKECDERIDNGPVSRFFASGGTKEELEAMFNK